MTLRLDPQTFDDLEKAYAASTQGNWRRGLTEQESIEEARAWLGRMVDYHPENLGLHMVAAMVDQSDPPGDLDDVEKFVVPALTGNGPNSANNAAFIELAHNAMPFLLGEIVALRNERNAYRDEMLLLKKAA